MSRDGKQEMRGRGGEADAVSLDQWAKKPSFFYFMLLFFLEVIKLDAGSSEYGVGMVTGEGITTRE